MNKTTVLNASKKVAASISDTLLARESKKFPGKLIFKRVETDNGFKITTKHKENPITVFQFVDDNGRMRFDYDDNVITFPGVR